MAHNYLGLSKQEYGEMVSAAFRFERQMKTMHGLTVVDVHHSTEDMTHKKEMIEKMLTAAHEYKEKHHTKLAGNYTSLDDHTLVAHLNEALHVLNCWNKHMHVQNQHHFSDLYDVHRQKYGAYTSTLHGMNAWYRNPRYRNNKKSKKDGGPKPAHAGGADKPPSSKPKRTRKRKGKGGEAAPSAGAHEHHGPAHSVVVHPSPEASRFAERGGELESLLKQLKVN